MKIGDRVQLHPATDRWMMGDRYGTITNISAKGKDFFWVLLDKSGRKMTFNIRDLEVIE